MATSFLTSPELHQYVEAQMCMLSDAMIARLRTDQQAGRLAGNFDAQPALRPYRTPVVARTRYTTPTLAGAALVG